MKPTDVFPNDAEAEAGALACVLQADGGAIKLLDQLHEPDFHDLRHIAIFRTLVQLQFDNEQLNPVSLNLRLKANDQTEAAGGLDYLYGLPDKTPSTANFSSFLAVVKDRAARRTQIRQAQKLERDARDLKTPLSFERLAAPEPEDSWFDVNNPPPDEPVLMEISKVPCATSGNLTTATAQKKSGKSAFFSAIASAAISGRGDNLGVVAFNKQNKHVLHFDTEQSPMDHYKLCKSILTRANLTEKPAFFKSCHLRGHSVHNRQIKIREAIRQHYEDAGVFIVIIDGHGDLVRNVNDPNECADYVAMLHAMAIETRCHIYGALHLNPGSDFKSRGHLGSELERKSQTNIRLEKINERFCAWGTENRGAPILKNIGPCFAWSDKFGMHMSIQTRGVGRFEVVLEDAKIKVLEAFRLAAKHHLPYSDLISSLTGVPGVKNVSAAERVFRLVKDANVIFKNQNQAWQITA